MDWGSFWVGFGSAILVVGVLVYAVGMVLVSEDNREEEDEHGNGY